MNNRLDKTTLLWCFLHLFSLRVLKCGLGCLMDGREAHKLCTFHLEMVCSLFLLCLSSIWLLSCTSIKSFKLNLVQVRVPSSSLLNYSHLSKRTEAEASLFLKKSSRVRICPRLSIKRKQMWLDIRVQCKSKI